MRTRRSVFFISALCILFLSSAVFAQQRGQRPGQGKMQQLAQRLGLDAEQMRQFQAIQSQQRQVVRPLKRTLQAKRQQMQQLWQTNTPDRDAILAKQAEMDHVRIQMRSLRLDSRLAIHAMLTPEQRRTMARLMKKRRGKRNHKNNRRGSRRDDHRRGQDGEGFPPREMGGSPDGPYEEAL